MTEPALNGGKAKSLVGDKSVLNGVLPKPQQEVEVGVSMFLPFVTPYKDAWEVLKDDEISTAQLVAMRKTDGQARALYRLITLPIRAALATSTFVPPSGVDGGEEETLFVQNMLTLPASGGGMSTPLNRVVAQMLMAVFDGFSPFEIVYWVPKFGPLKDKWAIKKLAYRPSKSITFLLDNNGDAVGFRQRTFHMGRSVDVEIPSNAFVYYAAQEEERPFYGQSFFQSAFYHYDKKVRLYYIAHLAAQRSAMGTRIGKLPAAPTRDEKEAFKKALADMGIAQWIALPDQYDIQTIKEGGNFDFLAYINHHNSQMSKSVLANFFDDQQGSGGDTTLVDFGRQSDALYMMMLDTIISEIETVFNNAIIPRFIDWNFGSGKYPKFKLGQLTAEQKAAMVDMFKSLSAVSSANQGCTPEFMMALEKQVSEEFGLEIDYEAVEERVTEEKQQQADLASQQFQQPAEGQPQPGAPSPSSEAPEGTVPSGFHLSAQGDVVELVRHVRSDSGVKRYDAPIGTPITEHMRKLADKVKGVKPEGRSVSPDSSAAGVQSSKGVIRTMTHSQWPGAELREHSGGVTSIKHPDGRSTEPQKVPASEFSKLGWKSKESVLAESSTKKPSVVSPLTDEEYSQHTEKIEAAVKKAVAEGKATDHQFRTPAGDWTSERLAQQKKLLDSLWAKYSSVPSDGKAVIAGGLGGAGKTTVLKKHAGIDPSQFVVVNPDDIKEAMAVQGMIPKIDGVSAMESSALVHEESSFLSNQLAARAYAEKKNVLFDITMSSRGSVQRRLQSLRDNGYEDVRGVFVDIPVETSVERALARHRRGLELKRAGHGFGGRYVPPQIIRKNSSSTSSSANKDVFEALKNQFSGWSEYDNSVSGRSPLLVAEKKVKS